MTGSARARSIDLVAAVSRDLCIGRGGALPWHLPEDLKRFRAITTGHAIVMGRKTFDSIGRALPNRRNIVVSRAPGFVAPPGVEVARDLDLALELALDTDAEPKVIGGGEIYRQALPLATRLFITWVDQDVSDCDARFPEFRDAFVLGSSEPGATEGVTFAVYERNPGG